MSDSSNPFGNTYSQACTEAFAKFVPGFDFLQGLVKNAGQTLPSIGQWVAPTLDPQELDKRIGELRTVQFWLEQNARMIATTVQALEVQRMTLGTLRTMNVPMADLGEALKVRVPDVFSAAAAAAAPARAPASAPAPAPAPATAAPAPAAAEPAPPAVDPMQWWGALTQQFTELATQTVQATSSAAAEAQARAAGAMQDVMSSVAAAAVTPPAAPEPAPAAAKKAAARRSPPAEPASAPAPARKAARKTAAASRKT
ncbi:hypothetical protein ABIC99_002008 [Sphaerotilus sulfidivorans]|uniref:Phasin family protein n=1 Tax=Sphaerotilus sulfidivorans TaxID=639200 RepID=A0A5C1PXL3_9BURK|nr:PhaM family polyhydroxyalkanoate granule multifunctional regulatory protein [Sphaerotilus sulfidivorans]NZD44319.1 hypothetical protein [Sphaerotilus sulfidivorans]QEN00157.1 hypothetical protein EWH46_04745 [Sphaerotilus sulfidivorans]